MVSFSQVSVAHYIVDEHWQVYNLSKQKDLVLNSYSGGRYYVAQRI